MKKIAQKNVYNGFASFSEIINWLKENHEHRSVRYDNGEEHYELGVFLVYNEETHKYDRLGLNAEMFKLIDEKEDEVYEMEEYFDENDNPLDDEFAKHYDLSKFVGEEYVEEK